MYQRMHLLSLFLLSKFFVLFLAWHSGKGDNIFFSFIIMVQYSCICTDTADH